MGVSVNSRRGRSSVLDVGPGVPVKRGVPEWKQGPAFPDVEQPIPGSADGLMGVEESLKVLIGMVDLAGVQINTLDERLRPVLSDFDPGEENSAVPLPEGACELSRKILAIAEGLRIQSSIQGSILDRIRL